MRIFTLILGFILFIPFLLFSQDNMKGPTGGPKSKQQVEAEKKQQKAKEAGYRQVEKAEKEHMKHQTKEGRKRMKETKKKSNKIQKSKRRTSLDFGNDEPTKFACLNVTYNQIDKRIYLNTI
jgi:hypothetical protein